TCEVEGSGVGAVRKCGLGEGAFVFEKVESIDEAQRVFTYSITESPLPLENYMGRMQIGPGADGGSEITWSCEFACDSAAEAEMTAMLEGAFSDGLAGLQSLLG
ncbi:MAG: SRPBCC family protein, partial [Candidatus Latescibacteria bacterium]|nr:SRPBCC family protein [Candidatus Latescibacterota bacterium]